MRDIKKIIIFFLALGIIFFLMFFAFSIFIVALILAPFAYLLSKFYKPSMQQEDNAKPQDNIINADY